MRLISVNIGLPQEVEIKGQPVLTGIYKSPTQNRVWLSKLSLAGDGQADLKVHGGKHQAAYSYPFEHYAHWQSVLGRESFTYGTFGENFTVTGLLEESVWVGDVLQIGGAIEQVTQPRLPCFKFGHRIGQPDLLKEFLQSGRSGFYLRVLAEGDVGAGDAIKFLGLQKLGEGNSALLRRTLEISSLAPLLRRDLEARLTTLTPD